MALTVTPSEVGGGDPVTITITGSSATNQTVDVTVTGSGGTSIVQVSLNDAGTGTAQWTAPEGWTAATFRYSTCEDVTITIL